MNADQAHSMGLRKEKKTRFSLQKSFQPAKLQAVKFGWKADLSSLSSANVLMALEVKWAVGSAQNREVAGSNLRRSGLFSLFFISQKILWLRLHNRTYVL